AEFCINPRGARLETVTRQVLDFRAREEARMQEQTGRAERMHEHIADLEREAQQLQRRLDREKHGARLDPLTRVANRKSFDERFSEEVLRRSLGDLPSCARRTSSRGSAARSS